MRSISKTLLVAMLAGGAGVPACAPLARATPFPAVESAVVAAVHGEVRRSMARSPGASVITDHAGPLGEAAADALIGGLIEGASHAGNRASARRVARLAMEAIQNIRHHALRASNGEPWGFVLVSRHGRGYTLAAGNLVDRAAREAIDHRLAELHGKSVVELQRLHQARLASAPAQSGGAGLGLIVMAIAAGGHLEARFESVGADRVLYVLQAEVDDASSGASPEDPR